METKELQTEAAKKAVKNGWSVRETEKYTGKSIAKKKKSKSKESSFKAFGRISCQALGTKVKLTGSDSKGEN